MKAMILAAVLVAGVAFGQDDNVPVSVTPTDGGAMVGVDLMAGKNAEGKREKSWGAAVVDGVKNNYGKILGGVAAGALTVYLIDESQDDGKKKSKASKEPPVKPDPTTGSSQTATAGGNSEQNSQTAGRDIINNYYAPAKDRAAR